MKRVAIYARVSTTEQAQGHSMDSQRDLLCAWARREGWQVVGVYEDPGSSGRSVKARPEFLRMIDDAVAGMFDAVLVLKFDRFARSLRDSATYRERLEEAGVTLHSYSEHTDDGPSGFLTRGMHELLAEDYSVELSHKTRLGWRKRAEKGLAVGDVPFGYRRDESQQPLTPEPVEAEAVRWAFETYARGTVSMHELAMGLNERGLQPRSKRGNVRFSKASIERMLANPVYSGDVTYRGEVVVPDAHAAIVSRETFANVARVRAARAARPREHGRHRHRHYLLSGTGHCATCTSRLWANANARGTYSYYRCSSRRLGIDHHPRGTDRTSVRVEVVEEQIDGMVRRLRLPRDWRDEVETQSRVGDADRDVDSERRRLEARIDRLRRMIEDDLLDYEAGRAAIQEAERLIAAATSRCPAAVDRDRCRSSERCPRALAAHASR